MWYRISKKEDMFFEIVPEYIWDYKKNKSISIKKSIDIDKKSRIPYFIYKVHKENKYIYASKSLDKCKDYILSL